jgi:mRNA interferase MazF
MYIKDFDAWNTIKKRVQDETRLVNIREGEIRWVTFGVNVGSEIDGKGVSFARPALIIHVIGSHLALVIPLSTKIKDVAGYVAIQWKGKTVSLCIHQLKVISQKRILSRMGKIPANKLSLYKQYITMFFTL